MCDLRGNVETRLRKLRQGEVDGVVLAAAGLQRLGLASEITELLAVGVMLPAAGQGALALESVAGHWVDDLLAPLNHPPTAAAVAAERAVLQNLGGGCSVPIGVLGEHQDGRLHVQALVSTPDGSRALRRAIMGPAGEAAALGRRLAAQLLADGAAGILEGAVAVPSHVGPKPHSVWGGNRPCSFRHTGLVVCASAGDGVGWYRKRR